jgi:exopolysaccharide production protein ExoZ
MNEKNRGTVKNIQALRGIAALLVVVGHLYFAQEAVDRLKEPTFHFWIGAAGVDIFFVISGYVISMTAIKREHNAYEFFMARLARIVPLYLLLTMPWIVLGLALHFPNELKSIWNGIFYLPLFDFSGYTAPPLGVGWTLSFEMWFYTVFALMLCALPARKVALLLPCFFVLGAALMSFYHGAWFFPRFAFHPFVVEFSMGCLIYLFQNRLSPFISYLSLAVSVGIFCFSWSAAASLFNYSEDLKQLNLGWERLLVWGVPAALAVAGCVGMERNEGRTFPNWLVGLGTISYTLYLVHRFVPEIVGHLFALLHCKNMTAAAVLMFFLCPPLAYLCWWCIEKPLTTKAQQWAKRSSAVAREP